jgi:hypothetical protein
MGFFSHFCPVKAKIKQGGYNHEIQKSFQEKIGVNQKNRC